MMRKILFLLALLPAFAPAARAAQSAATVGTTASQVVAANTGKAWRYISITNQSATAKISCAEDATPVIGAAGSVDIAPGATALWTSSNVTWNNAFNCVAAASSTPVTIEAQ